MSDDKRRPEDPAARETAGEGAPKRKRTEGPLTAEEAAEPRRDNERGDGRLIDRKRDARNPGVI
jgi:hypothetical protein